MRDEAIPRVFRMTLWWEIGNSTHTLVWNVGSSFLNSSRLSGATGATGFILRRRTRLDIKSEKRGGFALGAGKPRHSGEGYANPTGNDLGSMSRRRGIRNRGRVGSSSIVRYVESKSRRLRGLSIVVPARLRRMGSGIGGLSLNERRKGYARNAEEFQHRRIVSVVKDVQRRSEFMKGDTTMGGRRKGYARNAERSLGERQL